MKRILSFMTGSVLRDIERDIQGTKWKRFSSTKSCGYITLDLVQLKK